MANTDRQISISSGWFAASGLCLMSTFGPQTLGFGPLQTEIGFVTGVVIFAMTVLHLLGSVWHSRGRGLKVSGPTIVMMIGLTVLLAGAAWRFWPSTASNTGNEEISPQEKVRRKFLFDDARQEYLRRHPEADPNIFAALADPPASAINDYLKERGETWKFKTEKITLSSEASFHLECNMVATPISMAANEPLYTMSLQPHPLFVAAGGGLGLSMSPIAYQVDFGFIKPRLIYKCEMTNYGTKTAIDIVVGFSVIWQEAETDPQNTNVIRSGKVYLSRPWRFDISRLEPGKDGRFVFYLPNFTQYFISITLPAILTARLVGERERHDFELSSNSYIPFSLDPAN